MSLLDDVLEGEVLEVRVTRRPAGARDSVGRFTPGTAINAIVLLRVHALGTTLTRTAEGDSTDGGVDVWARLDELDKAYLEADGAQSPLGWTALQIASPKYPEAPPGDRLRFDGREYEITREEQHDGDGPLLEGFRRYTGTEKGVAP